MGPRTRELCDYYIEVDQLWSEDSVFTLMQADVFAGTNMEIISPTNSSLKLHTANLSFTYEPREEEKDAIILTVTIGPILNTNMRTCLQFSPMTSFIILSKFQLL